MGGGGGLAGNKTPEEKFSKILKPIFSFKYPV